MKILTHQEAHNVSGGTGQQDYMQDEITLSNWSIYGSGGRDFRGESIFNRNSYRQSSLAVARIVIR